MTMNKKIAGKLERELAEAIVRVIVGMGHKKPPLRSERHKIHLMSKAAVAVYEAAGENDRPREE